MDKSQIVLPGPDSSNETRFDYKKDEYERNHLLHHHYDTGLGSKIHYWAFLLYFSKKCIGPTELILTKYHWPEYKFIKFPNTKVIHIEGRDDPLLDDYTDLTLSVVSASLEDKLPLEVSQKIKEKNKKYKLDFSMTEMCEEPFYVFTMKHELSVNQTCLDDLEFIKPEANQFLKENFSNKLGLHLRRSHGVISTHEYVEECSTYLSRKRLDEWFEWSGQNRYKESDLAKFIHKPILNKDYFRVVDMMFDKHPDKQMYISSDVPLDFMKPFFDRYGSRITSRHDYQDEFFSLFEEELKDDFEYLFHVEQALEECFDLFAFAHTRDPILRKKSRWSDFAKFYRRKL
jgi:hypothetical protein